MRQILASYKCKLFQAIPYDCGIYHMHTVPYLASLFPSKEGKVNFISVLNTGLQMNFLVSSLFF